MSNQTTLDAFKAVLTPLLPGVTVLDNPQTVPYAGALPALIITELRDILERMYSEEKGNPEGKPNLYSLVYLERSAKETNRTLDAVIVDSLRPNIEKIKAAFASKSVQLLRTGTPPAMTDNVLIAGESIVWEYHPDGPFVRYLEQLYIGVRGTIEVQELIRQDVNDIMN